MNTYKTIAILLVPVIMFAATSNAMVYGLFKIKQDYISQNLCVEKDAEVNTCCGSCVLEEKLNTINDQEQKSESPPSFKSFVFEIDSLTDKYTLDPNFNVVLLKKQYHTFKDFDLISGCFQPPEVKIF